MPRHWHLPATRMLDTCGVAGDDHPLLGTLAAIVLMFTFAMQRTDLLGGKVKHVVAGWALLYVGMVSVFRAWSTSPDRCSARSTEST